MRPRPPQPSALRFRHRPTHVRVDRSALLHNLAVLRRAAGDARIMAVLKADAYGQGLIPIAHSLADAGVDYFGVAFLEEGIALRQAGVEAPVLVLGGLVGYQLQHFLDYHLELTASSAFKAQQIDAEARRLGRVARVHLKVDTGMRRIGTRPETAIKLADELARLPGVDPVGVFTHLVGAESPAEPTSRQQLDRFDEVVAAMRDAGTLPPLVHVANTAALLSLPDCQRDVVRPGIGLFGVAPASRFPQADALRPTQSVHTEIVFFKGVRKGAGVGYGHTWHAPRDGWLATLPVGYGDGYPRALSNRAQVLIGGNRYPVVGNISMDQTMVWVGDDQFEVGEPVVLLGQQGSETIDAWELAEHAGTIAYEILCGWASRVPRVYDDMPPSQRVDDDLPPSPGRTRGGSL
ncbi:MAG: alanine racemase [Myxococcales bacterium FL481]|nr:MAG: alanine racemase [Myxococcales bacterium FL481]